MVKIQALILDIGGVLIDVNAAEMMEELTAYSLCDYRLNGKETDKIVWPIAEELYATGEMSSAEFFKIIRNLLRLEIKKRKFWEIWNDIRYYKHNWKFINLIEELINAGKIQPQNIHILSNVNEMHWQRINNSLFPIRISEMTQGKKFLSYMMRDRKPNLSIYQTTYSTLNLDTYNGQLLRENCLFIDDRQENIDAARQFGWNALMYSGEIHKLNEYFDS